ncbi:adenosylcobinamide amidohydrolase [Pararhodospirillum oryzae]|uniref:Adenosylcobinamide amidohydrolase n=1 Tax=Pararhodospirillum oryzae TaxID=478448 RepID=A0A512H5I5_9PROT|nr:adenosylcobinamide amidohydrolase [Pararhodospirillum oryzae]GEO80674.1 adenosylcobinamide amidohydrolase [Pararhodospirillum oryzae]
MLLARYFDTLEVHRDGTLLSVRFLVPHQVLSTGRANGGFSETLDLVFNHQCCEPAAHWVEGLERLDTEPETYQDALLARHGLAGPASGMATAAGMRGLGVSRQDCQDLSVLALVTAGIEGNAARAGDPPSLFEGAGGFAPLPAPAPPAPPAHGTITTVIAVSQPVLPGVLVQGVSVATEAKCSVLQELSIPSRLSASLATGTGTDQIMALAPRAGARPLTSAGHHVALGALIGRAVRAALREALAWQNDLDPARQASAGRLLGRFGLCPGALAGAAAAHLPPGPADTLRANGLVLERDPLVVAAVAALVHLHDQRAWGLIPALAWPEVVVAQAAQVAAALGHPARWPVYHQELAAFMAREGGDTVPALAARALALGFADKWDFAQAIENHPKVSTNNTPPLDASGRP